MVTLGGVKIRLAEGKENKKLAQDKFHELSLQRSRAPESSSARVADVIEAFLAWAKIHRSEETNRNMDRLARPPRLPSVRASLRLPTRAIPT